MSGWNAPKAIVEPEGKLCGVGLGGTSQQCTHDADHDGEHSWWSHPKHQARLGKNALAAPSTASAAVGAPWNGKEAPSTPSTSQGSARPSPFALTAEDQQFCEKNGLDPAAFAMTRATEIAEKEARAREVAAGSKAAPAIVAQKAVLTEEDRRFCERMQIEESTFLATRQRELDDEARSKAYRDS